MNLNYTDVDLLFNASSAGSVYWHNADLVIFLLIIIASCQVFNVVLTIWKWISHD